MSQLKTIVGQSEHGIEAAVRAAEAKAEAFLRDLSPGVSANVFKVETLVYNGVAVHTITFVVSE